MTTYETSAEARRIAALAHDFMRERGITQGQVADRMGRGQTYVSDRLKGQLPIEYDMLATIAALASISTRSLVTELYERASVGAATGTAAVPARPAHGRSPRGGADARHTSRRSTA